MPLRTDPTPGVLATTQRAFRDSVSPLRPPLSAVERQGRRHVDLVEVGPLFPVHLDADEVLVHEGGDALVFERFPLHDVTPVSTGLWACCNR